MTQSQPKARLTIVTLLAVALAALASTAAFHRSKAPTMQGDRLTQAFSDQLYDCGKDPECWKLEAKRMQALAGYYKTHAVALNDLNRQAEQQNLQLAAALTRAAQRQ